MLVCHAMIDCLCCNSRGKSVIIDLSFHQLRIEKKSMIHEQMSSIVFRILSLYIFYMTRHCGCSASGHPTPYHATTSPAGWKLETDSSKTTFRFLCIVCSNTMAGQYIHEYQKLELRNSMPLLHSTSRQLLSSGKNHSSSSTIPIRYCFSCQIAHRSRLNTNQPWPTQKGAFISALLQSQDGFGFSRCAPPPSKYYAKVVIKGKPHFAPFLHSLRRRYSRRGGFYVLWAEQACRPWGCRGCHGNPRFWQIS